MRYTPGESVLNGKYEIDSLIKTSENHEIYKVLREGVSLVLKLAISEEGVRQNAHEIFVLGKLRKFPGLVALEDFSGEEALVLSSHGASLKEAVETRGNFRFSQVGKMMTQIFDSLALVHGEGVVLQNLAARHLLEDEIFPITICDLSAVCKEDSVFEEEFLEISDFLSPALSSGARKRVFFIDDFWALIFVGMEISGVSMSWRQADAEHALDLKMRFVQDARNFALGDVPRGFQAALAYLSELEEQPKLPPYAEVVARLLDLLKQLTEGERMAPVPESLLLLAQERVGPGAYTKISSSSVLLAALDARTRDVQRVRSDFASFSEYGNVMQSVVNRVNPDHPKSLDKVMQRDTINTCGMLYALPGARAAVCSLGPVCLFALITGSCRVREWCPLVHPQVPISVPDIKSRRRKLCFRFIGTGACPNGPRCDKIHPLRGDLDEWILSGRLNDVSAHERRSSQEAFEYEDNVVKVQGETPASPPRNKPPKVREPRSRSISKKRLGGRRQDNERRPGAVPVNLSKRPFPKDNRRDDRDIKRRRV